MKILEELKALHAYNIGDKSELTSIEEAEIDALSAKLVDEHLPHIIEVIEWVEDNAEFVEWATPPDAYAKGYWDGTKQTLEKLKTKLEASK